MFYYFNSDNTRVKFYDKSNFFVQFSHFFNNKNSVLHAGLFPNLQRSTNSILTRCFVSLWLNFIVNQSLLNWKIYKLKNRFLISSGCPVNLLGHDFITSFGMNIFLMETGFTLNASSNGVFPTLVQHDFWYSWTSWYHICLMSYLIWQTPETGFLIQAFCIALLNSCSFMMIMLLNKIVLLAQIRNK